MKSRSWKIILLTLTLLIGTTALVNDTGKSSYKCLIQLKNYQGEGAYVIVSIIDAKGEYVETLNVSGDDHEWYPDLPSWWKYREKNRHQPRLDGITGSTIGGGERKVITFTIKEQYLNKGYQLRFETAVEDKEYFKNDILVPLSTEALQQGKYDGKDGYIRMVRLIPVK